MSSEPSGGEIRNPHAAIEELYSDIYAFEKGESPDEIAQRWQDADQHMKDRAEAERVGSNNRRRTNIAVALINAIRKKS